MLCIVDLDKHVYKADTAEVIMDDKGVYSFELNCITSGKIISYTGTAYNCKKEKKKMS